MVYNVLFQSANSFFNIFRMRRAKKEKKKKSEKTFTDQIVGFRVVLLSPPVGILSIWCPQM